MKWYSNTDKPLKPNGNIQYSVYAYGPFLLQLNKTETINHDDKQKIIRMNLDLFQLEEKYINSF